MNASNIPHPFQNLPPYLVYLHSSLHEIPLPNP